MGENNLKSERTDSEVNFVHKVQETMVGRDIFRVMSEVIDRMKRETGVTHLDWGEVFSQILFNYFFKLESVGGYDDFLDALSADEKREFIQSFLAEFSAIKMDDTLFEDVKSGEGVERIFKVAGEVDIWTTGDIVNGIKPANLSSAGIYRLIHRALYDINMSVRRNDIIADEKAVRIPDTLDFFVKNNGAKELIVAVFDDKPKALKQAAGEIEDWAENKNSGQNRIKVYPLYVRAMRGRHGNEPWPEDYDLKKEEAENLIVLAEKIEAEAAAKKIPRENIIVFLDFDGTLSDNRISRLRQTYVMYTHIMKALKKAIEKYLAEKHVCSLDGEKAVAAMIKKYRDEVWDIYDLVVRPPHHFLNGIIAKIVRHKDSDFERFVVEALYEVDEYLQSSGWLNPKYTSDDMRREFLDAVKEYVEWGGSIFRHGFLTRRKSL